LEWDKNCLQVRFFPTELGLGLGLASFEEDLDSDLDLLA